MAATTRLDAASALLVAVIGLCDERGWTNPDVPVPDMDAARNAAGRLAEALGAVIDEGDET